MLSEITRVVTDAIGDHGLYAVFLLMLIDAVLPAASELVMVYGGALASGAFASSVVLFGKDVESGFWAWLAIAVAGTLGYVLGSIGGWAVGIYGGRPYAERHGKWLHLSPAKLDKADRFFDRWGNWFVLIGRVTPVVRSFVAVPAGIGRMPLGRFTLLTLPGSVLWCFALAGVGWALGMNWERFHESFHYVDYVVLGLIVAAAAYGLLRWRSSRLARRATDPAR